MQQPAVWCAVNIAQRPKELPLVLQERVGDLRGSWQGLDLAGCLHCCPHSEALDGTPEVTVVWGHGGQLEGQVCYMEQGATPHHLR